MRLQDTPAGSHLYLHDAPMSYYMYCPPAVGRIRVPKYFHTDYRNLEKDPSLVGDMEIGHFPDIFISNTRTCKGTGSPLHADALHVPAHLQSKERGKGLKLDSWLHT